MALHERPPSAPVDRRKIDELRKRVREAPGDVAAVLSLAEALVPAGEKREAILILNRVGAFLQRRGQHVQAIAVYKKVKQIDPKEEVTAAYLSQLELRKLLEEHGLPADEAAQRRSGDHPAVTAFPVTGSPSRSQAQPVMSPEEQQQLLERRAKKEAVQKLVSGIPFLKDVPPFLIEGVLERIHLKSFDSDDVVFREGDAGTSLVFVASGELRVVSRASEGAELELGRLQPGDIAGEISFLSGMPRTATLQATRRTDLLELERQAIDQIVRKNRSFGVALTNLYRERVLDAVLAKSPLFSGLSEEERDFFASRFEPVEMKAGDRIVVEGERDDCVFLIRRGQVRVTRNYEGRELSLAILSPHDIFGDVAAFRKTARTATVSAVTPVELLRLAAKDLQELVMRNPQLHARLEEIQLSRYMSMVEKLSEE